MKKVAVEIFIPCFIDQLFPETGFSMVKVLKKLGCEVHYNPKQTCCGQPGYNAGYFQEAAVIAEKFVKDFPHPDRYIVCPSASCVGMVRNVYENVLENEEVKKQYYTTQKNTFEFTEFLTDILEVEKIEGAKLYALATYHDSCSALRECGIAAAPRTLLNNVEGLELIELKQNETCCGFGGTFAVKFPAISVAMAEQKVEDALATKAEYIISTDYSCLMHLEAYIQKNQKNIKVLHVADVLASGW